MKNKEQKQKDLDALAEQFKAANAAMLVSFNKMTVGKDQELRRQLREAGVTYSVVKNTLARKAAAGTPLEPMSDQFKGVTAVALSTSDPVALSKAIAKFSKANPDIFTFKVGLVEGKVVELKDVESIASLPSREAMTPPHLPRRVDPVAPLSVFRSVSNYQANVAASRCDELAPARQSRAGKSLVKSPFRANRVRLLRGSCVCVPPPRRMRPA